MSDAYETGREIHREVIRTVESLPPEERDPLPEENRGSWYCPCAEKRHEKLIRTLANDIGAERIYDLGAGDLRLAVALCDEFEVVAYETNELLANRAYSMHGEPDMQLRAQDYYAHWGGMNHRNAVFACIGRTNELPGRPRNGVGIEGDRDIRIIYPEETHD